MLWNKRNCGCEMQMPQCPNMCEPVCDMGPIYEKPIEKCVQKEVVHEVQHICPVNTKVITNHIYKHTYVPQFSCSEEDIVTNMDEGSCCNFQ